MTGGVPPGTPCVALLRMTGQQFDVRDHAEVHDVAVALAGMMHFPQGLQNIFFRYHYSRTRFISFNR